MYIKWKYLTSLNKMSISLHNTSTLGITEVKLKNEIQKELSKFKKEKVLSILQILTSSQ